MQTASSSSSTWTKPSGRRAIRILSILQGPTTGDFFLRVRTGFGCLEKTSSQPTGCVNSTPTISARTELHSTITFHHANTRGSRAAKLRIAHLCVLKQLSSTCHVSFLAAPDTDQKHKFSLTYLTYLSEGLTFTNKPTDPRPIYTLRCSTAE